MHKTLEVSVFVEKCESFFVIANPKVHCKSSDLFDIIKDYLGKNINLARIKFVTLMILSMCKVQTVNLYRLAIAFVPLPFSKKENFSIFKILSCT